MKFLHEQELGNVDKSPPARGRGLKSGMRGQELIPEDVAPRAGAWIEIFRLRATETIENRRPPRGGVD